MKKWRIESGESMSIGGMAIIGMAAAGGIVMAAGERQRVAKAGNGSIKSMAAA